MLYAAYGTERCGGADFARWLPLIRRVVEVDVVLPLPAPARLCLPLPSGGPLLVMQAAEASNAGSMEVDVFEVADEFVPALIEATQVAWGCRLHAAQVPFGSNGAALCTVLWVDEAVRRTLPAVHWLVLPLDASPRRICAVARTYAPAPRLLAPPQSGAMATRQSVPPLVLVVLDGAADVATAALEGLTPLQHATACSTCDGMSVVARNGESGLMDPVRAGVACGSDTAHLNLLGFPPELFFEGRGAFEALGGGMDVPPGALAFKCNFAHLDQQTRVVLRRKFDGDVECSAAEVNSLCIALDGMTISAAELPEDVVAASLSGSPQDVTWCMRVKHAVHHRCGVVISGPQLTARVAGTDPLVDGKPLVEPIHRSQADHRGGASDVTLVVSTAVLRLFSRRIEEVLASHPVNAARAAVGSKTADVVLFRGPAQRSTQPGFRSRHGFESIAIAPTCVIAGLCLTLGFRMLPLPPGVTGLEDSDLVAKTNALLSDMIATWRQSPSLYFLHIKGCDEYSHHFDARGKSAFFERAAVAMQLLWDGLPDGATVAVTADHTTPSTLGDHSDDPVPLSIATKSPFGIQDAVQRFDELECACGSLGRVTGADLIPLMIQRHAAAYLKELNAPHAR